MMHLHFLGGAQEVGRSCVLLDGTIMLDCGLKLHSQEKPEIPLPALPDLVVISHAHLDHSGHVPSLYEKGNTLDCIMTPPTIELTSLLLHDTLKIQRLNNYKLYAAGSVKRWEKHVRPLPFNVPFEFGEYTIRFGNAGHIPGSAFVEVVKGDRSLVYSGDFKLSPTALMPAGHIPKDVDVLITESTYSEKDHPPRQETINTMLEEARGVIENGGIALFPTFALGRSQEMILILSHLADKIPVYVDGMAKAASEIVLEYPEYIRDADEYIRALNAVDFVQNREMKQRILQHPCAIITTAGMLEGGPILDYLPRVNEKSRLFLTGFQVQGTRGWELMHFNGITYEKNGERKKIPCPWSYYDLSAHAGKSELLTFIEKSNAEKVICMHGDHTQEFAEALRSQGVDAVAPSIGERVDIP